MTNIPTGISRKQRLLLTTELRKWPCELILLHQTEDPSLNSVILPVRVITILLKLSGTDVVFHLKCKIKSLNCVEKYGDSFFFWGKQSFKITNHLKILKNWNWLKMMDWVLTWFTTTHCCAVRPCDMSVHSVFHPVACKTNMNCHNFHRLKSVTSWRNSACSLLFNFSTD